MIRLILPFLLLLAACNTNNGWQLKPAIPVGPPLRIDDRVFLLTTQSHLRVGYDWNDAPTILEREFLTDLWAFDAATTAPVYRSRLHTTKNSPALSSVLLGAEGDTLWLFLPDGITAASASTGKLLATPASVEAANPQARGLLPRQRSSFEFGANGLTIHAVDGRNWRLHPQSFTLQPPNTPSPNPIAPAYRAESAVRALQSRGLLMPGRWLGLLDDSEVAAIGGTNKMYPDLDRPARRKLWSARVTNGIFSALTPLTGEFLAPGLFGTGRQPLLLHNPDSVLLLHQDRLDDARRYHLTRIAGPAGNTIWNAVLPFSAIHSALPGPRNILFIGSQDKTHHLITAVQLDTGALQTYNLSALDTNPPAKIP